MGVLLQRSNDALNINPPTEQYALNTHGSDWLWAVAAVYALSLLIVVGLGYFARSGERIFHYLFTISLFVGSVAYFTMASDLGSTSVSTADNAPGTREIFYAKYINWFTSWPELIIALGLISGVSWSTIVYNVALSWVWIASWLSGALVVTHYKWGFFAFGLFAYILLSVSLLHWGTISAKRVGIHRHYLPVTSWLVFLWLLYPIAYGLDDGGNKIGVTSGFIFWGILDLFTIPFLVLPLLILSNRWDYRALNIYFTQYGRVAPAEVQEREKMATAPGAPLTTPAAPEAAPEQAV